MICELDEQIAPLPPGDELIYVLHIPKTSGTSLYEFMVRRFGSDRAPAPMLWDQFLHGPPPITERTRVLTGHFGGLVLFWLKRWPKMITMLREPLARCLSHINHIQRERGHPSHALASQLTLVECCQHQIVRRTLDNVQSRYLASLSFARALLTDRSALAGNSMEMFEHALYSLDPRGEMGKAAAESLKQMTVVGLCEAHRPSLQLMVRALGWPEQDDTEEIRLNTAAADQRRLEDLTRAELAALRDINRVDLEVYSIACDRFAQQCREFAVEWDGGLRPEHERRSLGWRLARSLGLRK